VDDTGTGIIPREDKSETETPPVVNMHIPYARKRSCIR